MTATNPDLRTVQSDPSVGTDIARSIAAPQWLQWGQDYGYTLQVQLDLSEFWAEFGFVSGFGWTWADVYDFVGLRWN